MLKKLKLYKVVGGEDLLTNFWLFDIRFLLAERKIEQKIQTSCARY